MKISDSLNLNMENTGWIQIVRLSVRDIWAGINPKDLQNKNSPFASTLNYQLEHTGQVLTLALKIAEAHKPDMDILVASVLLHDIGRSRAKRNHGLLGAEMAEGLLVDTGFPVNKINDVKYAISVHVGWDESIPETLEACILWDADKLTKLGATGIVNKILYSPSDYSNIADIGKNLNEWLTTSAYIKDHMKTNEGLKIASKRYEIMKSFILDLNETYKKEKNNSSDT